MKLSQRLTRAGLAFILFGSIAAVMPHNDAAQASTQECTNGNRYRLTSDSSGATDATVSPIAKNALQSYYVFSSPDGSTGSYTAFTPTSFATTGPYTGTNSGNTFNGAANNTSQIDQDASLSAVVPSGTLVVNFTVSH